MANSIKVNKCNFKYNVNDEYNITDLHVHILPKIAISDWLTYPPALFTTSQRSTNFPT